MTLPNPDLEFLTERQLKYHVHDEQGVTCVVFEDWPLPPGYSQDCANLLVRLMPGYPDVAPDMWWFTPILKLTDGSAIPASELIETYLAQQWQRWSRHFQPGQWQSGIDGLESFLALIRSDVEHCAAAVAV